MSTVLGIDLGTSSVKSMILDTEHGVIGVAASGYSVDIPKAGYAEQSAEMWYESTLSTLKCLREQYPHYYSQIEAIGFSGQMHGLVVVDSSGHPLRPAILWLDQRSGAQAKAVFDAISPKEMGRILRNRIFPGFAFCSLLWVKDNEPDIYNNIYSIMTPKDYLRFLFTGKIATDYSDASATGVFNISKRQWAYELIELFGIRRAIFPSCGESSDIAGYVTDEAAECTGLRSGIPIVFGSGDQQAQSIGNGLVQEGALISNIGTGGQISCFSKLDLYDEFLRTHTFCHALPSAFTIFGATLCSGLSLNWLNSKLLHKCDFKATDKAADEVPAGSGGLVYLPYLSGERTPHMDFHAKGMFFGLTLSHDDRHFIRSVMEGVTYSMKDSLQILKQIGVAGSEVIASGGGASSPLWLQMQADIFEMDVKVCTVKEQACLGACILAALGIGLYKDVSDACAQHVTFGNNIYRPNADNISVYRKGYDVYRELYRRTNDLMQAVEF